MKGTRILMVILFFILPSYSFAQLSVGIKAAGPFFSGNRPFGNLRTEDIQLSDMGFFSLNAGVFTHYSFNNSFALQTEIKYTAEGFFYQINNAPDFWGTVALEYIEIPLLLQYKQGANFNWFIQSGFSIKCLIASEYFNEAGEDTPPGYVNDITGKSNNLVLKANLGGGVIYNFFRHFMFTAEMRWGYDITPVIDDVRFLKLDISLGIAYRFE